MEELDVLKKRLLDIEEVLKNQGDDIEQTANYIYNVAVLPVLKERDDLLKYQIVKRKMTTDEKIAKARDLMLDVECDRRKKIKEEGDNIVCKCGHKHKEHGVNYRIHYTAGFCNKCKCENFISK